MLDARPNETEAALSPFTPTCWSVILAAGQADSPQAAAAMEQLCQTYWIPLYGFIRRRGHSVPDAEDLTQRFFARLLARRDLAGVDPSRGRFRTFLLTSLQRFLVSEWRKTTAQCRDSTRVLVLDTDFAELQLSGVTEARPPELDFDRQWAEAVLTRVMDRLESEQKNSGRTELFHALKSAIWGERAGEDPAALARDLGMSPGAIRVAVHRLRGRFRELLRTEIAATVNDGDEVDAELRHLLDILVTR